MYLSTKRGVGQDGPTIFQKGATHFRRKAVKINKKKYVEKGEIIEALCLRGVRFNFLDSFLEYRWGLNILLRRRASHLPANTTLQYSHKQQHISSYFFLYFNYSIIPANVGLLSAWLSQQRTSISISSCGAPCGVQSSGGLFPSIIRKRIMSKNNIFFAALVTSDNWQYFFN